MNSRIAWGLGVLVVGAVMGGGGYWLGSHQTTTQAQAASVGAASATPVKPEKKLLYYRNPMGLPDTSPTPKKDPMGMDYIAVYEGEADEPGDGSRVLKISTEKVQKLGVRVEAAQLRSLDRSVRASGRIEADERRLFAITPKFEGYVERLLVNATGQLVGKGQPLFEVYSPELVATQREYAVAMQGTAALQDAGSQVQSGMTQLALSSLQRLQNLGMSSEQIAALSKSGVAQRTVTFRSPVSGVVMEKKAVQGMRFMPGDTLYQVVDLTSVWVMADVFEQDISRVKTGSRAKVSIGAYPDKKFVGTVTYIYPTMKPETRTVPVRIELTNPGLLLKPAMFAQVELGVATTEPRVTVPLSAVLDSGTRQVVLIQRGEGRFEPRDVKLGVRNETDVQVLDGVKEGELVVVSANFLIDAESNLRAALKGFDAAPAAGASAPKVDAAPKSAGHVAQGKVDEVQAKDGRVTLSHGPVASLKWPAMTMEFKVANAALLQDLKVGAWVDVEFVERQPGDWVITRVKPLPGKPTAP